MYVRMSCRMQRLNGRSERAKSRRGAVGCGSTHVNKQGGAIPTTTTAAIIATTTFFHFTSELKVIGSRRRFDASTVTSRPP